MKKMLFVAVVSAALGGLATQAFAEPQPNMKKALVSLEEAKNHLEKATADKGAGELGAALSARRVGQGGAGLPDGGDQVAQRGATCG